MELERIKEELAELDAQFTQLKGWHEDYSKRITSMTQMQKKCQGAVNHSFYRYKQITSELKKMRLTCKQPLKEEIDEVLKQMADRISHYHDIQETLPKKNSLYLRIVLGSVNVSYLSKEEKFEYKKDYENFKFYVTCVSFLLSFSLYFLTNNRVLDALFHFLLVWYYCTLTIRESILITNGSRIQGWWITQHFLLVVLTGILLIWPKSQTYDEFRNTFMFYSWYLSIVQLIQYTYQYGVLYKLRALGQGHSMDITVDGFRSWMWARLSYVLPFLFVGYFFQLYNAYKLYTLSVAPYCKEWMVGVLALMFLFLFLGNMMTNMAVIRRKLKIEGYSLASLRNRIHNKYKFSRSVSNQSEAPSTGDSSKSSDIKND